MDTLNQEKLQPLRIPGGWCVSYNNLSVKAKLIQDLIDE